MAKPPGKCIFCGGPGLSKEHVWPQWTKPLIPSKPGDSHLRGVRIHYGKVLAEVPLVRTHQGNLTSRQLRVVCRRCNSGWMSLLEAATKPILTPLIQGSGTTIDRAAQLNLALWITKTLMVAEFSRREDVSTPPLGRTLLKNGFIPPGWQIWIAHCAEIHRDAGYIRHAATLARPPIFPKDTRAKNTQSASFWIGRLFIQVYATTARGFTFELNREPRSVIQIWPIAADNIIWPPPPVSGADTDDIALQMDRILQSPNVAWLPPLS